MNGPPTPDPLVVDVDVIASQLGLDMPVDDDTAETLRQAILDAQADVEGYLGRPIVPTVRSATGLWPWPDGWELPDDDVLSVISATPEVTVDTGQPTGTYTVTYYSGLDVRNDPTLRPIVRYVVAAAKNSPAVVDVWREYVQPRGVMTSVSTDGQSATFAAASLGGGGAAGSRAPGALPDLDSLARWRRLSVYQRPTTRRDAWALFDDRIAYGPWGP